MDLKNILQNRIVNPTARINNVITTIGVVTDSDESNNYIDKSGCKRNKDNVVVRLYGSGADWFPKVGYAVVVEDSGDTVVIVARHVGNYSMDVRSKRQLRQDVLSDSSGCQSIAGHIM